MPTSGAIGNSDPARAPLAGFSIGVIQCLYAGNVLSADTTCYRHPTTQAAVGCQRCERPICPACMRQASIGHHCPECLSQGAQQVYTPRNLPGPGITVVKVLMAISIGVFVLQSVAAAGLPFDLGTEGLLFGPLVGAGEWWRIVTSAFLHGDLLHLGFNMWATWVFGNALEEGIGRVRFLLVYAAGLFGGALAVLTFDFMSPTLGASGAVLGLAGALVAVLRSQGRSLNDTGLVPILVINAGLPLLVPRISFWGHVGGIAGGFLAGWLLAETPRRFGWDGNRAQAAAAALSGLLAVGCIVVAVVALGRI